MKNDQEMSTPASTSCYLKKHKGDKSVRETKYEGMICFLFEIVACRPDIIS